MRWLLAPYAERRTYLILLYLVLGLPLGVFEFTLMVTGFSLGLGLLITLLGILVPIATLLVAHALATFERRLAWSLLDAPMPALPLRDEAAGFFWARLRSLITGRRTWSEVAFLLLRLPMVPDFTIAVTIVSLMVGGFVLADPCGGRSGVEPRDVDDSTRSGSRSSGFRSASCSCSWDRGSWSDGEESRRGSRPRCSRSWSPRS